MEKCTHPDCDYLAEYIVTNIHCLNNHQKTKKEIEEMYGKMTQCKIDYVKFNKNREYSNNLSYLKFR